MAEYLPAAGVRLRSLPADQRMEPASQFWQAASEVAPAVVENLPVGDMELSSRDKADICMQAHSCIEVSMPAAQPWQLESEVAPTAVEYLPDDEQQSSGTGERGVVCGHHGWGGCEGEAKDAGECEGEGG